jgi:sugar phosphate isomerase/epimerase
MKLSLLSSVFLMDYPKLEDAIEKTVEIGFDAIDICAWYPHCEPRLIGRKDRRRLRDFIAGCGIKVNQIATLGDATNGLWPMMDGWVQAQIDRLDFAADIGADHLETLPGWNRPDLPRDLTWKWAVDAHKKLAKHAEEVGIPLAVEFEPVQPTQLFWGLPNPINVTTLKELIKFLEEVGSSFCLANLDVGHCNIIAKGKPQSIKGDLMALKDAIVGTHFNDNDGITDLNYVPGEGTCDFKFYLNFLKEIGYKGMAGVELEGTIKNSYAKAKAAFSCMKSLLKEMGMTD